MALGNVQLTPEFVQAVRDAIDILDIAGEHTKLQRRGKNHLGVCPLHKEKTPSFSVDPDRGVFYCFGCGQGGDAIKLHQLLTGDDFPAAMESLAMRYGIPVPTGPPRGRGGRNEPDVETALEAAHEFFRDQLRRHPGPGRYLEGRKISSELIELYGLGYAPPGWRNLLEALEPRVPLRDLEAAGLVARSEKSGGRYYDRFRERLMFPIRNPAGRLLGYGGRTLADDRAKYVNSNETARFHKSRVLYGLEVAKKSLRESRRAFLVEGYFDVLGAVAAGVDGVVASMGTSLTAEQSKLLSRFADEVVVGYDGDRAGEEASRRALPLLLAQGLGVLRPVLGEGHDPDSLRMDEGPEALLTAIEAAPDALTVEIERLTPADAAREPRFQARAAHAVTALLKPIPDGVLAYAYARQAAERLGMPAEVLLKRAPARAVPGESSGPRPDGVRSVEEKILQFLLSDPPEPPPLAELPPVEAFFDPIWRNIYIAFVDLYRDDDRCPEARKVLARLPQEGEEVDRVARLLLQGAAGLPAGELDESLVQLRRRWQQQRLRELAVRIAEAQRGGDQHELDKLLAEKTALSRSLHRRPAD